MSTSPSPAIAEHVWTHSAASASTCPVKPQRRLKPEVAARLVTRRSEAHLADLYRKPVKDLTPRELAMMRAAFLQG